MLSAAHVLAMDAKNLLDVVDSVRIRHPELFLVEDTDSSPANVLQSVEPLDLAGVIQDEDYMTKTVEISSILPSFDVSNSSCDTAWNEQQSYENLSKSDDTHALSSQTDIYVNQEQIKPMTKDTEGIYDNNSIISQQQILSKNTTDKFNNDAKILTSSSLPTTKPPIAAKSGE